jgi:aryl-alcohol dehydrogenase-like predicted oxidoreductase
MNYAKLGKSDLKVSKIGLGALQFGTQGYGISDKDLE